MVVVEPLMPWTVSAVYMSTTLGVATVDYLPWAFFCRGGPVFSLLLAETFERTDSGCSVSSRPISSAEAEVLEHSTAAPMRYVEEI